MAIPQPRASLYVKRRERILRMGPGSGLSDCTQEEFELLLGAMVNQGISFIGLTAGIMPKIGDELVVVTNEREIEAAKIELEREQNAEDFVLGLKELFDKGLVSFVD